MDTRLQPKPADWTAPGAEQRRLSACRWTPRYKLRRLHSHLRHLVRGPQDTPAHALARHPKGRVRGFETATVRATSAGSATSAPMNHRAYRPDAPPDN